MRVLDLTGQRFGKLTVLYRGSDHIYPSGKNRIKWVCKCDCGNVCEVMSNQLRNGGTKSCGCIVKAGVHNTHGMSKEKIYRVWRSMKNRCTNKNDTEYQNYGLRGITVCPEWTCADGASNFFKWSVENGYKVGLTLDRIDNNKGYSPENCRWVTPKVQANNKRNNRTFTFGGKKYTIAQFAKENNINYSTLYSRFAKANWDAEEVLSKI